MVKYAKKKKKNVKIILHYMAVFFEASKQVSTITVIIIIVHDAFRLCMYSFG